MIGFFTNPADSEVIRIVRSAATRVAPNIEFQLLNLERQRASEALESRELSKLIINMEACIIDGDVLDLYGYFAELGSLAGTIDWLRGYNPGYLEQNYRWAIRDVDRRVAILTRKSRTESDRTESDRTESDRTESDRGADLFQFFGDYYTIFSLRDIPAAEHITSLADWLRETLNHSMPRVFISYRSPQRAYATKIADSLRRRGAAVWFDEKSIQPGASIPESINRGLGWCTHMVLIVDETFFESGWTKAEYESVLYRHLSRSTRRTDMAEYAIIPLFLVDPGAGNMPPMLQRIRGIDCRQKSTRSVMHQLWNAISTVGPR
jgi:hypothetical protein